MKLCFELGRALGCTTLHIKGGGGVIFRCADIVGQS
jgi:hypothetical protein